MAQANPQSDRYDYIPMKSYWFYSKKNADDTDNWIPFSLLDVEKLEQGYSANQEIVPTNGNRYDVNLIQRTRTPVYWTDKPNEVRRSKWFYSSQKDNQFLPFNEQMNETLEKIYTDACENQTWYVTYEINEGKEIVTFNTPNHMQIKNFEKTAAGEIRTLKRGLPDAFFSEIPTDDKDSIQHVCFVVHGIGPVCDIKFRSLVECVNDFRETSRLISQTHFQSYMDKEELHRVEFLPVYWHDDLHLDTDSGVDTHLSSLTLPSVMKVRTFINTTLADILFYTSAIYSQRIITKCIHEMNKHYEIFMQRNPSFKGHISLIGHSLGSVILYDILCNQTSDDKSATNEKLKFPVTYFFALGSPIGMFLTVRGITSIPTDFTLPTCKGLFNIFHPYDPIAYRLEPLIDPGWKEPPVLLTHYKGRKRIHLEIAEGFSRATDLTQKVFGIFKNTVTSVRSLLNPTTESPHANDDENTRVREWDNRVIGQLNQGRRIDYVLQQRPVEIINEYVFSFQSHVSYWCSEDTMLLIMKEILEIHGFTPDAKYETIDQMIKSNVLNCFTTNSKPELDRLRAYTNK